MTGCRLLQLPPEILSEYIFPHLSDSALCRLSRTCRQLRDLVDHDRDWKRRIEACGVRLEVYLDRCQGRAGFKEFYRRVGKLKVLVWGNDSHGRLGVTRPRGHYGSLFKPVLMETDKGIKVRKMAAGGWSIFLVCQVESGHRVWMTGKYDGEAFDYRENEAGLREVDPSSTWDRMPDVQCGRRHAIVHDGERSRPLPSDMHLPQPARPLRCAATWSGYLVVDERERLVYQDERTGTLSHINNISQTPGFQGDALAQIDGTDHFILAITRLGRVVKYNRMEGERGQWRRLPRFEIPATSGSEEMKLTAHFNRFVVYRPLGRVCLGNDSVGPDNEPTTFAELDAGHIIDISLGDHHTLALGRDGTVFAWGDHSHGACSVVETDRLPLDRPRPIPRELFKSGGRCSDPLVISVAAGGMHSGALVADLGEPLDEQGAGGEGSSIQAGGPTAEPVPTWNEGLIARFPRFRIGYPGRGLRRGG